MAETMRAAVFEGRERIVLEEKPFPHCGPTDAIVKVSLTTICGTDVTSGARSIPSSRGGSSVTSRWASSINSETQSGATN